MYTRNGWLYEMDGTKRVLDPSLKVIFMPYNIEPEDYSRAVKGLMNDGWTVQIEIV